MIDPTNVPNVANDELVGRYILQSSYVRSDQTVRPNAFMPPPDLELSVTRHLLATTQELWSIGNDVAAATGKTLHGRGDVQAAICVAQSLEVLAAPLSINPNHAHVTGWPIDKSAQKNIAQEIASRTKYV